MINNQSSEIDKDISDNPTMSGFPSILLGQLQISVEEAKVIGAISARSINIFGAKVNTGQVWKGIALFRNELLVVDDTGEIQTKYQLAQRRHCVYSASGDEVCEEDGDMFDIRKIRCLHRPPQWKHASANIPMDGDETFFFLGQFFAKNSMLVNQYFGSDQSIYLFALANGDILRFQAFMQDTTEQTAEDHYRLEEQMMAFDRDYKNIEKVAALSRAGDKYLYQYIADHKRSGKEILDLLLQYAETKKMKQQIIKRLKQGSNSA